MNVRDDQLQPQSAGSDISKTVRIRKFVLSEFLLLRILWQSVQPSTQHSEKRCRRAAPSTLFWLYYHIMSLLCSVIFYG